VKILLAGRDGQLGWELERVLAPLGEVAAFGRQGFDLEFADSLKQAVRNVRPDLIVNATAYNAVDRAEVEPETAMQVNCVAPGVLADEAKRLGALLVHFSTDYVFDGTKRAPYTEDDPPAPLGAYGRSKLAGETAIRASGARALIFRTAWVYSGRRENFVLTMRKLIAEKPELRVVNDQTGTPTWARSLAEGVAKICAAAPSRPGLGEGAPVYHATCRGETTRFGWVEAIAATVSGKKAKLTPVPSSEFPTPARRPLYSVLSGAKLERDFGVRLPDWRAAFEAFSASAS